MPPLAVAAAISESKVGPPESEEIGGIGGRRSFRQLLLKQLKVAEVKESGETLGVVAGHGPVRLVLLSCIALYLSCII